MKQSTSINDSQNLLNESPAIVPEKTIKDKIKGVL